MFAMGIKIKNCINFSTDLVELVMVQKHNNCSCGHTLVGDTCRDENKKSSQYCFISNFKRLTKASYRICIMAKRLQSHIAFNGYHKRIFEGVPNSLLSPHNFFKTNITKLYYTYWTVNIRYLPPTMLISRGAQQYSCTNKDLDSIIAITRCTMCFVSLNIRQSF